MSQQKLTGAPAGSTDDEKAIKEFLLDIQCLDKLSQWSGHFNLFDVLKVSKTEIRHSNILAWLLDPSENHGLGDAVLRRMIQRLVSRSPQADAFLILLKDFRDVSVLREWEHIDLLVISHKEKFLLCIENKVFSGEGDGQLTRYYKTVQSKYGDYQSIFVYLTPDGLEPEKEEDQEIWRAFDYSELLNVMQKAREEHTLSQEASIFIKQYEEAVRRYIVGDQELQKICRDIYARHKRALDLIYENRPDTAAKVAEILKEWCRNTAATGEIGFDPQFSNKTYIRFTTSYMTKLLPEFEEDLSGWNSKSMYYYEVENRGDQFKLILSVSHNNLTEQQLGCLERLLDYGKVTKRKKEDWVWWRIFATSWYRIEDEFLPEEELKGKVMAAMDHFWKKLRDFEENLQLQADQTAAGSEAKLS